MLVAKNYKTLVRSLLQSPWTLLTVGLRSIGALSVMKLVAVYFGSSGVALFSHFQNLVSIITQIPDQGTNLAIIRLYNETDKSRRSKLIGTAILINVISFIVISSAILLNRNFFLEHFPSFRLDYRYLWILLICVFFFLLNSVSFAILYARQLYKMLFGITAYNMVIVILAVWFGTRGESIEKTMIFYAGGWALYSLGNFGFLYLKGVISSISLRWDKAISQGIVQFLFIAIAGVIFGKLVDYFVRDFALEWFGQSETGIWQAQVKISDSYRAVFMGTLGLIFYSQISKMLDMPEKLASYIKQMLITAFGVTSIGLLLVWVIRKPIILGLFQEELLPAADFIEYQLIADLFALPAFLLVFVLIAQKKWKAYIAVHLVSGIIYLLGITLTVGFFNYSIEGIPMANMIRMFLFCMFLLVFNRKWLIT